MIPPRSSSCTDAWTRSRSTTVASLRPSGCCSLCHREKGSHIRDPGYPLCKLQCTQKRCFSASMAAPLSIRDLSPGSLQKGSNVVQEFCGPGHRSCLESQCWVTSKLGGGTEPHPSPSSGHSEVLLHDPPRMPTVAPSWAEGKAWAQKFNESQCSFAVAEMNPSALSGDRLPGASDPILATLNWRQRERIKGKMI